MQCHQNKSKPSRDANGMFSCTINLTISSDGSRSPQNELYDSSEHLSALEDNATSISDPNYTSDDEWSLLPMPLTVDECIWQNWAVKDAGKQAQRTAVWRDQHTAQIQAAEDRFDGQSDKHRGVKWGAYHVGGLSKCTVQDKKQKVWQSAEATGKSLDSARVIYQLEDINL
jgi:hypothetical protein